jgi:hypothetical protein
MEISEHMRTWLEEQKQYHEKELERYKEHRERTIRQIKNKARNLTTNRKKRKQTFEILESIDKILSQSDWEI